MFNNKQEFVEEFTKRIEENYGRSVEQSHPTERFMVLGEMVRDFAGIHWKETKEKIAADEAKQMYYFSMEFLIGRLLTNNLMNLGIYELVRDGLQDLDIDINELEDLESDAGLGTGGLGRLAACFLDSLASLQLPGNGNCIRYQYGLFRQKIENGYQVEVPDQWLKLGNVWEVRKPKSAVDVKFWGHVEMRKNENGELIFDHVDAEHIRAVPYDMPVVGHGTKETNTLRLWSAEASDIIPTNKDFRLYLQELQEICLNVYPDDSTDDGKILRLKQQYFFVSAGVKSIIRSHLRVYPTLDNLGEKIAIQLNDTHPVLAIPELMRVLMFGWEFPPYKSGGLGTACYGMGRALAKKGTEILFVLPQTPLDAPVRVGERLSLCSASGTRVERTARNLRINEEVRELWREKLHIEHVDSLLLPYDTPESYDERRRELERLQSVKRNADVFSSTQETILRLHGGYGPDLMSEVYRYACAAVAIARKARFDVIHVHDWMTYPAGILVRKLTGKPLVAHIHALEHDRSGDNMNRDVAGIERAGLEAADRVVAVSHYTKRLVMRQYGIPGDKIEVVHNAVSRSEADRVYAVPERCAHEKRVLFMGRVTFQKGPDYFVEAAKLVLDRIPDVRFVMAGSGDMLPNMVRRVAQLRIGSHFHFTGFLKDEEVDHMYAVSDLYVMPSVSEPFGIAPLEAMAYDVPVLISRQSGVAEVVRNAIKVDFWDIREMANKICAILSYPFLAAEEVRNCREELKAIRWENVADRLNAIYAQLVSGGK